MKVYGIGSTDRTKKVTVYICSDESDNQIIWSHTNTPDMLLTDEEAKANNLPLFLNVACTITQTSFVLSQSDDSVVYDVANDIMIDRYPEWVATLGDYVRIYEDVEEVIDPRFNPRNAPEDAGLYDVMQYER